jgi:hypothetical protein
MMLTSPPPHTKDLVVERNDSVGYVVQVFELMDDDFDELEDNLKHLCKCTSSA